MRKTKPKNLIPVLITTDKDKLGVFFAYIEEKDAAKQDIVAYDIQMAIYWSKDIRGVLGLTVTGPNDNCNIGPACPKGLIKGIDFVGGVTEQAERAWRKYA